MNRFLQWTILISVLGLQGQEVEKNLMDQELQPIRDELLLKLVQPGDGILETKIKKLVTEYLVSTAAESVTSENTRNTVFSRAPNQIQQQAKQGLGALIQATRPRPSQAHIFNQISGILNNVNSGNIPGIVDSALGIRFRPDTSRQGAQQSVTSPPQQTQQQQAQQQQVQQQLLQQQRQQQLLQQQVQQLIQLQAQQMQTQQQQQQQTQPQQQQQPQIQQQTQALQQQQIQTQQQQVRPQVPSQTIQTVVPQRVQQPVQTVNTPTQSQQNQNFLQRLPVLGGLLPTMRPRPTQQHVYNQVNGILGGVNSGNITGIVDQALGIRAPMPVRNLVNAILNTVFCNGLNRLFTGCGGSSGGNRM